MIRAIVRRAGSLLRHPLVEVVGAVVAFAVVHAVLGSGIGWLDGASWIETVLPMHLMLGVTVVAVPPLTGPRLAGAWWSASSVLMFGAAGLAVIALLVDLSFNGAGLLSGRLGRSAAGLLVLGEFLLSVRVFAAFAGRSWLTRIMFGVVMLAAAVLCIRLAAVGDDVLAAPIGTNPEAIAGVAGSIIALMLLTWLALVARWISREPAYGGRVVQAVATWTCPRCGRGQRGGGSTGCVRCGLEVRIERP